MTSFEYLKTYDNYLIRCGLYPSAGSKKNGSCIVLSGRSEFMEKYKEVIYDLHKRGFDVYSFDWRGQGLSSRMLENPHKGYILNYDTYIKDMLLFFEKIVLPKARKPLIILSHSMGGHITLRFMHDYPNFVHKAVLTSPMFDIETFPLPKFFARLIVLLNIKLGKDNEYIIGAADYSYSKNKFRGNGLTSDPTRFLLQHKLIKKNPSLALGGVTYAWLHATFESIDLINSDGYTNSIKAPVLIINAKNDKVVSREAQKEISLSIQTSKFITIPDARHEILQENDKIRALF